MTPQKRAEAIEMFNAGMPHMAIAEKLGVSHMTLRNEADRDPELFEAEKEMYLQWQHRIEFSQVRAACGQLKVEPGYIHNETAAIFMLKHLDPKRYGDSPVDAAVSTLASLIDASRSPQ